VTTGCYDTQFSLPKTNYADGIKYRLKEFYSIKDLKSANRKVLGHKRCITGGGDLYIHPKVTFTMMLKYKIEGFFEAGLLVDATNKEDIQLIVDEEHMAAFGMTIQQRRAEKRASKNLDTIDWSIYDEPLIGRKNSSNG